MLFTCSRSWPLSVSAGWSGFWIVVKADHFRFQQAGSGSILVAEADHFRFQQAGFVLYLWQRLTPFGISRLTRPYTWSKADHFRFQQAGQALYLWHRLTSFGLSRLAWFFTGCKGWPFLISTGWLGSLPVVKADHFRFKQAGQALYLLERVTTSGFSKLAWLHTSGKGWPFSVSAGWPGYILVEDFVCLQNQDFWPYAYYVYMSELLCFCLNLKFNVWIGIQNNYSRS
jgi:hypothetical protein